MKSEADRVKEYLAAMVQHHHRSQGDEVVQLKKEVLFAILDASSDVIGDAIKGVPDARIFSRDDLRAFLASVVAEIILKAGRRVLVRKGR